MRKVTTVLISASVLLVAACASDSDYVRAHNPAFPERASSQSAEAAHDDDEAPHDDGAEVPHDETESHDEGAGQHEAGPGSAGDPADADRVIEVEMLDSMAFDPTSIDVAAGETVTFRVTNTGKIEHDFTIGNEATQSAHGEEMATQAQDEDGHAHGDSNAMAVHSGDTGELTWTFDTPGRLLIGCHVPGHYAAGMVAEVQVS
jgi:uncharacterized cupredoxin-like copper-binding protein